MKQLIVNGFIIELEKKKIKNMYLRILPPEGRIRVTAPYRMSEQEIRGFVQSKLDWIEKQKAKIYHNSYSKELKYETDEEIFIWGRSFLLIVKDNNKHNQLEFGGEKIILSVQKDSTKEQRKKLLDNWYRKALMQEIPLVLSVWEQRIGVKASGFTIRDMKTRWGTCNIRTKNICLNLQLAKKSPKFLEYVIVHELVHLLEGSHNHIFKGYMDQFLPNWHSIRKELNAGNTGI